MVMNCHKPVLLEQVLAHLHVKNGQKYIDATLGDGGHTLEILRRGGLVLGIDYNEKSLATATARVKEEGLERGFIGVRGNFRDIDTYARENDYCGVSGILYDLGFSSSELERELGLSFLRDEPLDMRLDKLMGVTAADLVNSLPGGELERLVREYSDERFSRRIAREIVKYRSLRKIQTTKQLTDLIVGVTSPGYEHGRIHPATRTFQALRIAVNDELGNLEKSLPRAARLLLPGGKLIVISFHSLEDGMVKKMGRAQPSLKALTKKPIEPSYEEVAQNVRARSAKMRVYERCT